MTARLRSPSIEHLLREVTPQVLGTVVRRFRDFAAAEDAVQEALLAAAMVHGATKGLELLDALRDDARVVEHHRLDAVRAHLLELAGDREGAVKYYRAAAGKTASLPERNYLLAQAARLSEF
jgi:predicted RNA polymerase sigma factor